MEYFNVIQVDYEKLFPDKDQVQVTPHPMSPFHTQQQSRTAHAMEFSSFYVTGMDN